VSENKGPRPHKTIYRSKGMEISTNIPGFKWPTREEKIAGLLECGLIDEAEAERLHNRFPSPAKDSQ
jgi:hypothetical protein